MQTSTLKKIVCLFILVSIITSCASNHFIKRKYTLGNYRENRHSTPKTNEIKINYSTLDISDKHLVASADSANKETNRPGSDISFFKNTSKIIESKINSQNKIIHDNPSEDKQQKDYIKNQSPAKKPTLSNNNTNSFDTLALLAFIIAIAAIICSVVAILLNPAANILFLVSLVLGLVSLPLGLAGLKNYRKNEESKLDFAFSITAVIVGWIAIIALILGIIIAILLLMFLLLLI